MLKTSGRAWLSQEGLIKPSCYTHSHCIPHILKAKVQKVWSHLRATPAAAVICVCVWGGLTCVTSLTWVGRSNKKEKVPNSTLWPEMDLWCSEQDSNLRPVLLRCVSGRCCTGTSGLFHKTPQTKRVSLSFHRTSMHSEGSKSFVHARRGRRAPFIYF